MAYWTGVTVLMYYYTAAMIVAILRCIGIAQSELNEPMAATRILLRFATIVSFAKDVVPATMIVLCRIQVIRHCVVTWMGSPGVIFLFEIGIATNAACSLLTLNGLFLEDQLTKIQREKGAELLESLPLFTTETISLLAGAGDDEGGPECSICSEEFTESDLLSQLGCLHTFHRDCLLRWFKTSVQQGNSPTCPLCRREVFVAGGGGGGGSVPLSG